jgi:hypothetical protein
MHYLLLLCLPLLTILLTYPGCSPVERSGRTAPEFLTVDAPSVVFIEQALGAAETSDDAEVRFDFERAMAAAAEHAQGMGLGILHLDQEIAGVALRHDGSKAFSMSQLSACCATLLVRSDSIRVIQGSMTDLDLVTEIDHFLLTR